METGIITRMIAITLFATFISTNIFGQTESGKTERPAQVSFMYPLGTNGIGSAGYSNRLSLNMLWGVNGGVNGFELGGVGNYNSGDVTGMQIGGVFNVNTGSAKGALLGGVCNVSTGDVIGLQLSGVLNMSRSNRGISVAGVANVATDSIIGLALSGSVNFTPGSVNGVQLGVVNVALGDVKGAQIGVVNHANRLKGFQFGVVNIVNNSENGIPIGLISIVNNGYYNFSISANEVVYANFSYKMGVEKFYTIFNVGYTGDDSDIVYGYGFGSLHTIKGNHGISVEAVANNIVHNDTWDELNLLNRLSINYNYNIGHGMSLFGGPALNVYVTDVKNGANFGTIDVPYTIYRYDNNRTETSVWVGFNLGLSVTL